METHDKITNHCDMSAPSRSVQLPVFAGASWLIFAAMMKSFSWSPLIFLVRSDTVA